MEAMYTLSQRRQPALVLEIREAMARHTRRSCGPLESARAAAMRGDHATALERTRACIAQFPEARDGWANLAVELAMVGDEAGACEAAATARRYPSPTPLILEAAALGHLLAGDRDEARRLTAIAARQMTASGFASGVMPVLAAVQAALRHDAAAIGRLRAAPGLHQDPAAPLWDRLIALAAVGT